LSCQSVYESLLPPFLAFFFIMSCIKCFFFFDFLVPGLLKPKFLFSILIEILHGFSPFAFFPSVEHHRFFFFSTFLAAPPLDPSFFFSLVPDTFPSPVRRCPFPVNAFAVYLFFPPVFLLPLLSMFPVLPFSLFFPERLSALSLPPIICRYHLSFPPFLNPMG